MRCLTLAKALREQGGVCCFICRESQGHLLHMIRENGFEAISLPLNQLQDVLAEDETTPLKHASWLEVNWEFDALQTIQTLRGRVVDWLIVDHYAIDFRWENKLRPYCKQLMVIDDLADRLHDCDVLLDQNLGRSEFDYAELIPIKAKKFIGPNYALLRPEFLQLRSQSLARRTDTSNLKNLFISMGGVDKDNITGQILDILKTCDIPLDLCITVVLGRYAPWLEHVQSQAAKMPWPTTVLPGSDKMAKLMAESDLAIGGAGGTAWERCCLGLPTLIFVQAENQQAGASALDKVGAAIELQTCNEIPEILNKLFLLESSSSLLAKMTSIAAELTDGKGCIKVSNFITDMHHD